MTDQQHMGKCAHVLCHCRVAHGEHYWSDHCEEAASQGLSGSKCCRCGHLAWAHQPA